MYLKNNWYRRAFNGDICLSALWFGWRYVASQENTQVLYIFWSHFDANSKVMSDGCLEWLYMARLANTQVLSPDMNGVVLCSSQQQQFSSWDSSLNIICQNGCIYYCATTHVEILMAHQVWGENLMFVRIPRNEWIIYMCCMYSI